MIHEITEKVGKHRSRKRIGRGRGSGQGKTSGRGHKGAASRSGWTRRPGFEGGQMPLVRRMPKRGFTNVQFRTLYAIVNVQTLEELCEKGAKVDAASLFEAGIIRDKLPLKVLGHGELTKKLDITAAKFSASAKEKIQAAGGSVTEIVKRKWRRAPKRTASTKDSASTKADSKKAEASTKE